MGGSFLDPAMYKTLQGQSGSFLGLIIAVVGVGLIFMGVIGCFVPFFRLVFCGPSATGKLIEHCKQVEERYCNGLRCMLQVEKRYYGEPHPRGHQNYLYVTKVDFYGPPEAGKQQPQAEQPFVPFLRPTDNMQTGMNDRDTAIMANMMMAQQQMITQQQMIDRVECATAGSTLVVQVPPGISGGQQININTARGPMTVVIPPGLQEGQAFNVNVSAAVTIPTATPLAADTAATKADAPPGPADWDRHLSDPPLAVTVAQENRGDCAPPLL